MKRKYSINPVIRHTSIYYHFAYANVKQDSWHLLSDEKIYIYFALQPSRIVGFRSNATMK
jgi:hypothetical protein